MVYMEAMTAIDQDIADKLRGLRAERRLSQEELAELSGISESTIYRIEKGTLSARLKQLDAICSALGIDVYDFLKAAIGRGS